MSETETRALFVTQCAQTKLVSVSDSLRHDFPIVIWNGLLNLTNSTTLIVRSNERSWLVCGCYKNLCKNLFCDSRQIWGTAREIWPIFVIFSLCFDNFWWIYPLLHVESESTLLGTALLIQISGCQKGQITLAHTKSSLKMGQTGKKQKIKKKDKKCGSSLTYSTCRLN